ncbi:MAG: NifB/NifX family molybdenum-iron cluster-binding protein [Candidatus Omnitrophica bacterium]|nr:NifB/NifX family molybdenum-iron cluster-binding protein [Candidatus Omnitrophota bacterium]
MKVAISTDGDFVSAHFGRCPHFTIVDIEDGVVRRQERIDNPGHHPGFLPRFLQQNGVSAIIAGGMGQRALMLFADAGIETIVGISGAVDEVIHRLVQGKLESGQSLCQPGAGKGYGLDKTECEHPDEDVHDH